MIPGPPPNWTPTLEAARETLPAALGLALAATQVPGEEAWKLEVRWRTGEAALQVFDRRIYRAEELALLKGRMEQTAGSVLVTPYLTVHLARRCVELGLQFIDGAGNIHLTLPGLHLCIIGNRAPEDLDRLARNPTFKGFNRKGLQVVFGLLADPALLQAPYRELARATGVAVGTVGEVLKDLAEAGLLLNRGRKRALIQEDRLLEGWITNFPYKLRPNLNPRRYRALRPQGWPTDPLDPQQAQWGGEVAADRLTGHLQPARFILYTVVPPEKLATHLRLRPDPAGDVEILERFWHFPNPPGYPVDLVPPLLVHADLIASGDPRNVDLARMIHVTRPAP